LRDGYPRTRGQRAADLRVLSNGLRQVAGRPARVRMGVAVRTEAVLLQQVPISSLALSLQEHTPRVRMDVAVHTEAVLLQQVPRSSLALSLQEHPPPGANGAGGFRTEAVLLQQLPISALALSLQEHPPRVRMDVAVRTEAVLLQQVPISSLALSLQEPPARVRMDVAVRTEAVLLPQGPILSLALSLQEHPPRVRINWVLRLLVHCCGGACAILLRLGNHPVTEPLQGRRLGLALGNDQIIGVAAVDAVIVGDHQSAALQLAADQERRYQRHAHAMHGRLGQHGEQLQARAVQIM